MKISGEPCNVNIPVDAKLVARLAHNRVNYIETRYLVLRPTFSDELLNTLNNMLVKLDSLHGSPGDKAHLCLGHWRLRIEQGLQLIVEYLNDIHA